MKRLARFCRTLSGFITAAGAKPMAKRISYVDLRYDSGAAVTGAAPREESNQQQNPKYRQNNNDQGDGQKNW